MDLKRAALLLALLAGCGAPPSAPGCREPFSDDPALPEDRFGLFIGIDTYPLMKGMDLHGCSNDARHLRKLFATRFGVRQSALLLDGAATRDAIGALMNDLLRRVREAAGRNRTGAPLWVVIAYSGHGSYVADQAAVAAGQDEEDGRDETWVAADSTLQDGRNDVRDDEIHGFLAELSRLGARTLFISDSCHSGSVHRAAEESLPRALPRKGEIAGPAGSLFGALAPSPGESLDALPGLVAYTACRDDESARECVDAAGASSGRLNFVLQRVLSAMDPATPHDDVFRRVAEGFAVRGFTGGPFGQSPCFHADPALRRAPFFGGSAARIDPSARLAVAMEEFRVAPGESLTAADRSALAAWARKGRFRLGGSPPSVAVYRRGVTLAVFPPEALPDPRTGEGGSPLREVGGLDALETALFEIGLLHRARSLDHDDGTVSLRLVAYRETITGWAPLTPPAPAGIPILRDGDHFTLAVRNRGAEPLYMTFFDVDLDSRKPESERLSVLVPPPAEETRPVPPGQEFEFFVGRKFPVSVADNGGRHHLKLVATSVPVDFAAFLHPPPGQRAASSNNPLDLLNASAQRGETAWKTSGLRVDVAAP